MTALANGHPADPTPRTFRRSESIAALAAALAKAQGSMAGAKKDADNPFFKTKYADLASVWDAIRGPLAANGLAVMQFPRGSVDGVEVETVLVHSSGEWVAESLALPVSKRDAQGVGSAITYARRYGLQSVAGVAPDDDDGTAAANSVNHSIEANSLSPQEQFKARQAHPPQPRKAYCTQQQIDALRDIGDDLGLSNEARVDILRRYQVKRPTHLTAENATEIVLELSRKRVADLLTEHGFNLDDVRPECPTVTADTPAEMDQDQCNAALAVLRAAKERSNA